MKIPDQNEPDEQFAALVDEKNVIAKGGSRIVYAIAGHPTCVLKVVHLENNLTNWTEILVYSFADQTQRQSLAAVMSWSRSGKYLVMERLAKLVDVPTQLYTPQAPFPFLTDIHLCSMGRDSAGDIKIWDYGATKNGSESYPSPYL